ncbi:hypothetical protein EYR41_003816 [Orbilia oligospora]|uniref:Uncharacterized protein n=1 Tax=Orbilia oligospora TaxID=2813651 RepID=A0A8H2E6N0_ORBOL|nr:hypothetical protein EYR41_003816 [Orbilia oligospora]
MVYVSCEAIIIIIEAETTTQPRPSTTLETTFPVQRQTANDTKLTPIIRCKILTKYIPRLVSVLQYSVYAIKEERVTPVRI